MVLGARGPQGRPSRRRPLTRMTLGAIAVDDGARQHRERSPCAAKTMDCHHGGDVAAESLLESTSLGFRLAKSASTARTLTGASRLKLLKHL
jgi:hypothetical protein